MDSQQRLNEEIVLSPVAADAPDVASSLAALAQAYLSSPIDSKPVNLAHPGPDTYYRTLVEHGTQAGQEIAEFALKTQMRPRTH